MNHEISSFLSLKPYVICLEYYTTCEAEEGKVCIQVAVETVCPAVANASAQNSPLYKYDGRR